MLFFNAYYVFFAQIGSGINAALRHLTADPVKIIGFGVGCSDGALAIAAMINSWGVPMVSWGAESDKLSNVVR